jgi:hypothetical protein
MTDQHLPVTGDVFASQILKLPQLLEGSHSHILKKHSHQRPNSQTRFIPTYLPTVGLPTYLPTYLPKLMLHLNYSHFHFEFMICSLT